MFIGHEGTKARRDLLPIHAAHWNRRI